MKTLKKNNISKGSSINSPVPVNKNCDLPPFFNSDYFGHVVVQTLEELESIPCKLRQDGMIATVVQDDYSDYQLQSSRTGLGICNNNAWIKISKGDIVYDGDNLIIFSSDKERNEYLKVGKAGQIIYSIESDNYFKIDNDNSYTDPFPEKLDTPTEQGTDNNLDYKIPTYVDGKPYWRNSTDFGKVDTIDGIEADENKNIALGVVRKSESNTVTDDFSMQQENGAYVSIASNGLKVGFGGITATYGNYSISVDNLVPNAAYKYQELLFPKRAVKNVKEKVYPVTYVNGVKADETGRVDISGVAMNWTNSSQRFSELLDKSADATYNKVAVLDSANNLATAKYFTSEFVRLQNGSNIGFALKHRSENPNFYGLIGNQAIDLSLSYSTSSDSGANGYQAIAIGNSIKAIGDQSIGIGTMATTSSSSVSIGNIVTSGNYSVAIGKNTDASGSQATAVGNQARAIGFFSVSIGSSTVIGQRATAVGVGNKANVDYSNALGGSFLNADVYKSVVLGFSNPRKTNQSTTTWIPTDDLFVVGNGNNAINELSEALNLKKNGHLTLPSVDNTMIDTSPKSVVTKEYLDIRIPKPPTTGEYILKSVDGVVSWVLN